MVEATIKAAKNSDGRLIRSSSCWASSRLPPFSSLWAPGAAAAVYSSAMKFETLAVHAGAEPDPSTAALAPPIHLSTTFEHAPDGAVLHGFMYIRDGNPTQSRLEAS